MYRLSVLRCACRIMDKMGLPQGGDFYVFLTRYFLSKEWILTNIFRKMSNPHPLPDPPSLQRHNIDGCITARGYKISTFFVIYMDSRFQKVRNALNGDFVSMFS